MSLSFCIANWKAQRTPDDESTLSYDIVSALNRTPAPNVEVILSPSFLSLSEIARTADYPLSLAAQDCYWQQPAAATGEITPLALAHAGCRYVIVGHSERRRLLGETDEMIAKKCALLFETQKKLGLIPIICVGETAQERKAGKTQSIVSKQLSAIFDVVSLKNYHSLIVAYEPVWAISTSSEKGIAESCSPGDCDAARGYIQTLFNTYYPAPKTAPTFHMIYGGSVDEKNAASYVQQGGMQGVLVGSASLHAKQFCAIVHALN
ncbi:MAG: triose-phosphate isomerase, partial [Patescibacteria group bacterium]